MKVAYLSAAATLGGAERCLLDIMASVRKSTGEIQPLLVAPGDGPLAEAARGLGIETRIAPMPRAFGAAGESSLIGSRSPAGAMRIAGQSLAAALAVRGYARQLDAILETLEPDLVHSNGLKPHLLTRLLRVGRPVIWHLHDYLGLRPVMAPVLRWASRRAHAAIGISRSITEDARRVLPGLAIDTVHNAVDATRFAPDADRRTALDALSGLPPGPAVRVGLVAAYALWKGHELFLTAAARAAAVRPDLRFYVVGGPIYQTSSQLAGSDLRRRARQLGIADRVGFVGFQDDVASVYRALDICVHASTRPEPFGLTIAEAMACGRCVIVSREGGAAELFTDGEDAVGFEPRDPVSLADAIVALASDAERRARLGERARETALLRFSPERLGSELAVLYRRILARNQT